MLTHEVVDLATALLREFNLAGQGWSVRLSKSSTRAGRCDYVRKQLEFSTRAIAQYSNEEMEEVILHELAHAIVGPGHEHGRVWAAQVRELGGHPQERHSPLRGGGLGLGVYGFLATIWIVASGYGALPLIVATIVIALILGQHYWKNYGPVRDEVYCLSG